MKFYKNKYSFGKMCQILKVDRSSYYKWLKRGKSKRQQYNEELLVLIRREYIKSGCLYGSPRITAILKKNNVGCSRARVARLMRQNNIVSKIKTRYKTTTDSRHRYEISKNLLGKDIVVSNPNEVWVSDITYIKTREGFIYLTTVMDLYNREIVGHSKSSSLKTIETTMKALRNACIKRRPDRGLIFHSDRGVQYACNDFRKLLNSYGMIQSMSGRGNCYDNAVCESFFKTLKTELIYQKAGGYKSREDARREIFEYIECFYNYKRLHSALEYNSPREYLERYYRGYYKCA
jgi:transposase InsO family protein